VYAAVDVTILGPIYDKLLVDINNWGLENVVNLESALTRSYGDAMCENVYLDPVPWTENMNKQFEQLEIIKKEFYELMREHFYNECVEAKFIQKQDEYNFNWNSSVMKKNLIRKLYPEMPLEYTTVKDYKQYLKNIESGTVETELGPMYLDWFLNKDYEKIELYFIQNYSDFLIELGIFVPKDTILINLNSPDQKLILFKFINPDIESTDKEVIAKINHPLAFKMKEYNKASKLSTSYGQNFLDAISPDGMFRVKSFTQILNTGRSSMSLLQLLPGKNEYRNPFNPNNPKTGKREDGYVWKMVGADYASQEAVVAATFCNETSLLEAISKGCDFHSTCASLMFPEEWARLGGEKDPKDKPSDKTLLGLRNSSKTTSFGLFYGKSAIGLGESLNIPATTGDLIEMYPKERDEFMATNDEEYTNFYKNYKSGRNTNSAKHDFLKQAHKDGRFLPNVATADDLIDRFYSTFPNIYSFLSNCAEQAVIDKYIRTPDPIARVRKFPYPEHEGDKSSIKRAAMNMPIQGSSANMTKYAICIIKNYIEKHNLQDKMKFCLPLHDEIQYIAREDFAEEALRIVISHMEEAAEFILNNKLLKAEGAIENVWCK
jgi:hypothetical protein